MDCYIELREPRQDQRRTVAPGCQPQHWPASTSLCLGLIEKDGIPQPKSSVALKRDQQTRQSRMKSRLANSARAPHWYLPQTGVQTERQPTPLACTATQATECRRKRKTYRLPRAACRRRGRNQRPSTRRPPAAQADSRPGAQTKGCCWRVSSSIARGIADVLKLFGNVQSQPTSPPASPVGDSAYMGVGKSIRIELLNPPKIVGPASKSFVTTVMVANGVSVRSVAVEQRIEPDVKLHAKPELTVRLMIRPPPTVSNRTGVPLGIGISRAVSMLVIRSSQTQVCPGGR